MSTLNVDKVDPSTGTALEIGSSGDTITIPSGATIVNSGTATGFGAALTGSTNNQVTTVTAANAISGEAKLLFDPAKLTIGNASEEDTSIVFDGHAQDFHIGLDDSEDDLSIGVGSALGTTTALSIDEDRNVTISSGVLKIGTLTEAANDQGFNFDSTGATGVSCAQSAAVAITTNLNASGMLLMNETALSGACCLVLTGGGAVNIVAQATGSTFANTSTPSTSQIGVYLDSLKLYVKNGISGTASINMQTFRTRVQS
jgi:hypothetical protein